MALIVQKYGGTSVADPDRIRAVAEHVAFTRGRGHDVVVVVSAMGKTTDNLIKLANDVSRTQPGREMDMLLTTGERISMALVCMALADVGVEAMSFTGSQVGIVTDTVHTKAKILEVKGNRVRDALAQGRVCVVAGFQGISTDNEITTLGRGGSDTTATALAAVLDAELCEIYTDVEGVFTTDPRVVADARKVERISYDEMLELASLGAGVMHSRSIEFAKKFAVNLRVRPSYSDGPGTLIAPYNGTTQTVVTGVAFVRNEALITLIGLPDQPGVMSSLFTALSGARIPVDMVVQNTAAEGLANVSFTVSEDELPAAMEVVKSAASTLSAQSVQQATGLSKVSIVGHGMQTHTGVAARLFQILADSHMRIHVVTTSDIKISVLIDSDRCNDAILAVHSGFGLHQPSPPLPGYGRPTNSLTNSGEATDEVVADIVSRLDSMESILVSDITSDTDQCRISLGNLPDDPVAATTVFAAVAEAGILVDLIVQNTPRSGVSGISFTVPAADGPRCLQRLQTEQKTSYPQAELHSESGICKLIITGIGLRSHTDVGRRVFRTLAENRINVDMISTSEIKISIVVSSQESAKALAALQSEFR
ncbi:MAG TPA: aspartate kinase [Planctomycetaceae bacterium]|nr:aspartate kinase [Planctomycetaceae bacterium]